MSTSPNAVSEYFAKIATEIINVANEQERQEITIKALAQKIEQLESAQTTFTSVELNVTADSQLQYAIGQAAIYKRHLEQLQIACKDFIAAQPTFGSVYREFKNFCAVVDVIESMPK